MADMAIKIMYSFVNAYCLVIGTAMTWAEEAIENYPYVSALVTAMIIDRLIW